MTVLALDSSAITAGCAVVCDDENGILAEKLINNGLTHSQTLLPLVDDTLRESGRTLADIDCVAVSAGPGSFTGVRIGIATVKGIAFTDDIPCIGVSTLDAIAYSTIGLSGIIAAVMDARREQVYNALFSVGAGGEIKRLTEDRAISITQLAEEISELSETVWFCGDGAELCYNRLKNSLENVKIAPEECRFQSGRGAALAALAAGKDAVISAEELLPKYLRLPQAERELNNKKLNNLK